MRSQDYIIIFICIIQTVLINMGFSPHILPTLFKKPVLAKGINIFDIFTEFTEFTITPLSKHFTFAQVFCRLPPVQNRQKSCSINFLFLIYLIDQRIIIRVVRLFLPNEKNIFGFRLEKSDCLTASNILPVKRPTTCHNGQLSAAPFFSLHDKVPILG